MTLAVERIEEGLWRWTTSHPSWPPGAPGGEVSSVYHETAEAVLLIDPLVPPPASDGARRFLEALDRDVRRLDVAVAILLTSARHVRSARALHERYRVRTGSAVWAHGAAQGALWEPLRVASAGQPLPGGVEAIDVAPDELAFHLPTCRTLVVGDVLRGADGGLRAADGADPAALRALSRLHPLRVLPAHGAPVLHDAGAALAATAPSPA